MAEPMSEKHYEDKFEYLLWKLIKKRAEDKDISYFAASQEVVPEYMRTIKYGDKEFEDAAIQKRVREMAELAKRQPKGGW